MEAALKERRYEGIEVISKAQQIGNTAPALNIQQDSNRKRGRKLSVALFKGPHSAATVAKQQATFKATECMPALNPSRRSQAMAPSQAPSVGKANKHKH